MIREPLRGFWHLAELIPRWEIDNSGRHPVRKFVWGGTGRRDSCELRRDGKVWLHTSVGTDHGIAEPVAQIPPSCI